MSREYSPSDIDILAEIEKDLKNRKAVTFDPLSAIPPYSLYYLPRTQFEEFSAGLQREGLIDVAQAKKLADKYNELMKSKALTEELCTGFDDQRGHSSQTQTEYEFGRSMRSHFSLDKQRVFLNHGSFGATPNVVRRTMKNFQDEMENNCDRWFVVRTRELYDETRKVVAPLIHANHYDDIALVDNASAGVNSVLRSLPLLLLQEKEKKLAETEDLKAETADLKAELEQKEKKLQEAEELRRQLEEKQRIIDETEGKLKEAEKLHELLEEKDRKLTEANELRAALEENQRKMLEAEALRQELAEKERQIAEAEELKAALEEKELKALEAEELRLQLAEMELELKKADVRLSSSSSSSPAPTHRRVHRTHMRPHRCSSSCSRRRSESCARPKS